MQAPTVHGWTGYSLPITILQANIIVCIARCLYTLTHNAHEYAQWIKPYVEIGRDAPTRSLHTIALQTWQLASVICTFMLSLVSCELALRWSDHSDTASGRSHPYRISALVYAVEMAKLLLMLPWVYFQLRTSSGPGEIEKMISFESDTYMWYLIPCLLSQLGSHIFYPMVADLGADMGQLSGLCGMLLLTAILYNVLASQQVVRSTNLKTLLPIQWAGLLLLLLGLLVAGGVGAHHVSHPWRGCVLALAWATCAATTALSLEVLLTNRTQTQPTAGIDQSVLVQSVVLLSFTSLVSLTWWAVDVTYYNEPKYMFHGWDGGTWAIATFMVVSGIAQVFVIKFLGSIWNVTARILSVPIAACFAFIFLSKSLSMFDVFSMGMILFATWTIYMGHFSSTQKLPESHDDVLGDGPIRTVVQIPVDKFVEGELARAADLGTAFNE